MGRERCREPLDEKTEPLISEQVAARGKLQPTHTLSPPPPHTVVEQRAGRDSEMTRPAPWSEGRPEGRDSGHTEDLRERAPRPEPRAWGFLSAPEPLPAFPCPAKLNILLFPPGSLLLGDEPLSIRPFHPRPSAGAVRWAGGPRGNLIRKPPLSGPGWFPAQGWKVRLSVTEPPPHHCLLCPSCPAPCNNLPPLPADCRSLRDLATWPQTRRAQKRGKGLQRRSMCSGRDIAGPSGRQLCASPAITTQMDF